MFIGDYDLMFLIERILVLTLCYVGVCSNSSYDKFPSGLRTHTSFKFGGLGIVYFASAKTNNPIEVCIVLTCIDFIIIKFLIFPLIDCRKKNTANISPKCIGFCFTNNISI